MRLLADENIARLVVISLRADGHDVMSILETARGISDAQVLEYAREQDRVILTHDRDFGNVLRLDVTEYAGILLIRLRKQAPEIVLERLRSFFKEHHQESIKGTLVIIAERVNRFYH